MNIKESLDKTPTQLNLNESVITDHATVSNIFYNYFVSIREKLLNNVMPSKYTYSDFLNFPNGNSFFIDSVLSVVSSLILITLKNDKIYKPNSIPTFFLKLTSHIISKPLSIMINNLLKNGEFPEVFKEAQVIPIYKAGSLKDFSNYQPIWLLSNLSKVFEKAMHNRLYKFLEKFKCLYQHQYGFRSKHSTTLALIEITEKIRRALNNKHFACRMFVDLQKTFDTHNDYYLRSQVLLSCD
nr:uncharacterized protein LOC124808627 [Hydra vulgaris]